MSAGGIIVEIVLFHIGEYKEKTNKDGVAVKVLTKRAERLYRQGGERNTQIVAAED